MRQFIKEGVLSVLVSVIKPENVDHNIDPSLQNSFNARIPPPPRVTRLGKKFTHWAIVNFGQLFENFKSLLVLGYFFPRLKL
jgi:hypothetical protein